MALTQGDMITPGGQALAGKYNVSTNAPSAGAAGQPAADDPFAVWENHFLRKGRWIGYGPSGEEGAVARPTGVNLRVKEELDIQTRDRKRLADLAKRIGIDLDSPGSLGKLWLDAVDEARAASLVEAGVDPWKVLEAWARTGAYRGGAPMGEGAGKPRTITQTQSQANITDAKTAREVIMAALRQRLQRDPSAGEISKFIADLNAEERANPTVSTTTSKYDAEGNLVDSDTVTEGGAPAPGDFAEGFLTEEHDPEADAIRAGQDYFSVAQQLVGSVV